MISRSSDLHELREKMNRFNEWERSQTIQLTEQERLLQFIDLFEIAMRFDDEIIERAHREHFVPFSRLAQAIIAAASISRKENHATGLSF
jgi:hypothetical protein